MVWMKELVEILNHQSKLASCVRCGCVCAYMAVPSVVWYRIMRRSKDAKYEK